MANAAAEKDEAPDANASAKGKGGKAWLPIVIAVVVSTLASAGISYFMGQRILAALPAAGGEAKAEGKAAEGDKEHAKLPPTYVPMEPAFVINLEDASGSRFLQVQVQLMVRDEKAAETIKAHEPRLRNQMLMLFSQQTPQDLATREGKEKLQAAVLAEVQKIMNEEIGKPYVEAVYFTSFVIQ